MECVLLLPALCVLRGRHVLRRAVRAAAASRNLCKTLEIPIPDPRERPPLLPPPQAFRLPFFPVFASLLVSVERTLGIRGRGGILNIQSFLLEGRFKPANWIRSFLVRKKKKPRLRKCLNGQSLINISTVRSWNVLCNSRVVLPALCLSAVLLNHTDAQSGAAEWGPAGGSDGAVHCWCFTRDSAATQDFLQAAIGRGRASGPVRGEASFRCSVLGFLFPSQCRLQEMEPCVSASSWLVLGRCSRACSSLAFSFHLPYLVKLCASLFLERAVSPHSRTVSRFLQF